MAASKWEVRTVPLEDLKRYDKNPRTIDEASLKGLQKSLERFGYVEPIVWNETTGRIVGGHQRYKSLLEAGVEDAAVIVVQLSEEEEIAANLTLNNPEIEGQWDEPVLDLLQQIQNDDEDLFKALRFDGLRDILDKKMPDPSPPDPDPDPDDEHNGDGGGGSGEDTKCPCCGHAWEIGTEDVSVITVESE